MVPVESRNATTLLVIIKEWIKPGTTIISDCWKAYNTLNNEGYTHMTVHHSLNFKDPETGVHSNVYNTIESAWRHSKASMSNYCRKKTFYAGYLAKYMFTKHCRLHELDATPEFLKQAVHGEHENNEDTADDSDDEDYGNDEDENSDGNGDQATG